MYQLRYDLIGKDGGDFRPKFSEPEQSFFVEQLEHQLNRRGITKVFSPHCKLTTRITLLGDGFEKPITPWFIRTEPGFDGAMITEPQTAIALFNADCPVVILFDKNRGQLVLLHAGFRCLVPKENKPSIITEAFRHFPIDPEGIEAFIGFGAGPCCYGTNHLFDEIYRPEPEPFVEVAKRGPRNGQLSFNLLSLARKQLRKHGIREGAIAIDDKCTACYGREDNNTGQYHSNIYESKSAGRNLVLAWFTAPC